MTTLTVRDLAMLGADSRPPCFKATKYALDPTSNAQLAPDVVLDLDGPVKRHTACDECRMVFSSVA